MADVEEARSIRSSASSGTKRKREAMPKFYAVQKGHRPGIYHSWNDCLSQVKGFKGALFKSFPSLTDAEAFLNNRDSSASKSPTIPSAPTKFYAVQNGHTPGVYTDWSSAQAQITGITKPRHKSFASRAEAEAFINAGKAYGKPLAAAAATQLDADMPKRQFSGSQATKADKAPAGKKQKKNGAVAKGVEPDENGLYPPGYGPLPEDADDGFDERLILNPETGLIEYKTEEQMNATKAVPAPDHNTLRIWTDGSSLGNGKLGSTAGIGVYFGPGDSRNVSAPLPHNQRQTNQRAELTALQRALELTPIDRAVTIFSDSSYAINCATTWSKTWVKNNWMTSSRKPVENRDIVEEIVRIMDERARVGAGTELKWLKGHASDAGNTAADALAVNGARMGKELRLKVARDAIDGLTA